MNKDLLSITVLVAHNPDIYFQVTKETAPEVFGKGNFGIIEDLRGVACIGSRQVVIHLTFEEFMGVWGGLEDRGWSLDFLSVYGDHDDFDINDYIDGVKRVATKDGKVLKASAEDRAAMEAEGVYEE